MISTFLAIFAAGLLTILLPCVLPMLPIVLGVGITDRNKWRPIVTILGMIVSFVGFTFVLQVVLSQFVELADYIRIATYYLLLLFGLGFLFHSKPYQIIGAVLGGFFFLSKGWIAVIAAMLLGIVAMEIGGRVASKIQQFGSDVQTEARRELGSNSLITAFIIGLTMGLVWVPCAGPGLGFALSVVRNKPGLEALLYLSAYGLGAGIPLIIIGYGGQAATHSVRSLTKYSGRIKQVSGFLLILSAIAFQLNLFQKAQTWLVNNTAYGIFGTNIEESLFGYGNASQHSTIGQGGSSANLPILGQAPAEFVGLGPWHNSPPLTLQSLKGKVVLIDFWTYSCINCIRTLPYIEALWEKHKNQPFVLIGVHTPEFTFEKSEQNVSDAIKEHGLTYPIPQDNDYQTWNAFNNQYWPAHYLIDAKGNIRYTHFGEGAYDETDQAVTSLLAEIGSTSTSGESIPQEVAPRQQEVTPETYLHSRGWDSFGNAQGQPDATVHTYTAPTSMELHKFYLSGTWQLLDDERQVLMSDEGEIRIRALAGEVNLVLGLEGSAQPVNADIEVDGKPYKTITIQNHDLYMFFKGSYGQHDVILKLHGKGVAAYAFTFGS